MQKLQVFSISQFHTYSVKDFVINIKNMQLRSYINIKTIYIYVAALMSVERVSNQKIILVHSLYL